MKAITEKPAPVWAIHGMNLLLLSMLLLGAPAVAGFDLGLTVASSETWLERLVIAGLVVGVVANAIAGGGLGQRRHRQACRGWAVLHLGILSVGVLAHWGWIDLDWVGKVVRRG